MASSSSAPASSSFSVASAPPSDPASGLQPPASNFGTDVTAFSGGFPGPYFPDTDFNFGYDDGLDGDNAEAKRRRIARACDMCRKKKIKCDGRLPRCSHCQNYGTECVFTHVEKKRNPPKGTKYIEGLENRLKRMEHLLRLSGLLTEDDEGETDLGALEERLAQQNPGSPTTDPDHRRSISSPVQAAQASQSKDARYPTPQSDRNARQENSLSPQPQPEKRTEAEPKDRDKEKEKENPKDKDPDAQNDEDLAELMCSLMTNSQGETRYFGSSSGLSIFSPKGISWITEKAGETTLQSMMAAFNLDHAKWTMWRPDVFGDVFRICVYRNLPPKDECISLITDFFQSFNQMFPLFHEPTFLHLVEKQYSDEPYEGSGWWASLNVVLAISYRMRIMKNMIPSREEAAGWGYFKNALTCLAELTMRNTDLLSVQALVAMSLFLQGTPNPQPSFYLVGAAIRLAHSIGLHKRGSFFGLNNVETEQRKRVFWIAYILDKDISLRSGRPPMQADDDWNVELPSEDPYDNIGNVSLADGKSKCNLFRLMCQFSVIQSKVYTQLYTVKASKHSDGDLLNIIGSLDSELEQWKNNIPIDFRPEYEINLNDNPLTIQVVCLHFAYYNCLTTIHRMSIHHGYWSNRLAEYMHQGRNSRSLNPRVFSSAALCVSAARASINLIKYIPSGDYSCVWLMSYYPTSALLTVFANILQNPSDPRARSDLKLIGVVVDFLYTMIQEESTGGFRRMHAVCKEFNRIAEVVISKAEKGMTVRQKRKQERERERIDTSDQLPNKQPFRSSMMGVEQSSSSDYKGSLRHPSQTTDSINQTMRGETTDFNRIGLETDFNALLGEDGAGYLDENNNYVPTMNTQSASGMNWFPPDERGQHLTPTYSWQSKSASQTDLSDGNALRAQQSNTTASDTATSPIFDSSLLPSPSSGFGPPPGQGKAGSVNGLGSAADGPMLGLDLQENPAMVGGNTFQQPFVPTDFWNMPMTFEWDWASAMGEEVPMNNQPQ